MSEEERNSPQPEKSAAPSNEAVPDEDGQEDRAGSSVNSGGSSASAVGRRALRWDAIAAIVASFIGFLALLVGGYTAYVQRHTANLMAQQTRAQVWPHLELASSTTRQSLLALNKGVGPAIVRGVVVRVDGKPQANWDHVMKALGMPGNFTGYGQSTLNGAVLSPSETLKILVIPDKKSYQRFITAVRGHLNIEACFCSTLGECWRARFNHEAGTGVHPVGKCPQAPTTAQFED